tara:strand:+ start:92 stop:724 length:633 start_codon:yes stop_codon:yes gene_type:complete
MKNLLSILLISVILFSCSEKRIFNEELILRNDGLVYYESELFSGISIINRWNETLEKEISYKNGLKHGPAKGYFLDGSLHYEWNYVKGKYRIQGIHREWWGTDDGKGQCCLRFEGNYENGYREGLWKWWYQNGQLMEEGKYAHRNGMGNREGLWKEYYKDGTLKSEGEYMYFTSNAAKSFVRHNIWKEYDETGNLISQKTYEYGNEINCE